MAAARSAARLISRRFSSGGKVLSEEEKAAENVYIRKVEKERLEKLAQKGAKPEGDPTKGTPENDVKTSSSTAATSTGGNTNYAVFVGAIAVLAGAGWYFTSKSKKPEEVKA